MCGLEPSNNVATQAYEQVTGEPLEADLAFDYETGSNEEGWA